MLNRHHDRVKIITTLRSQTKVLDFVKYFQEAGIKTEVIIMEQIPVEERVKIISQILMNSTYTLEDILSMSSKAYQDYGHENLMDLSTIDLIFYAANNPSILKGRITVHGENINIGEDRSMHPTSYLDRSLYEKVIRHQNKNTK